MKLRIRELRHERGWTIDHMADLTAYSRGYISQLETEKRQPSAEALEAIAHAFGLSVPDLYADRDLGEHLEIMRRLSPEDQAAVVRHALVLSQKAVE
jgi:transcriptional regulator with XRE-family HTH domain